MISVKGNNIMMTRGDTETLIVTIRDVNGNPYTLSEDEYVEFCAKLRPTDKEPLIHKVSSDGSFTFERSDTWGMRPGKYEYNIRVENGTNTYHTIIEGHLNITAVVDDASD